MADYNVGDRCPSALDSAYFNYTAWCQRIGYPAASYEKWLMLERKASGLSVTHVTSSYAQSRQRLAYLQASGH
jgi:hypothetical protein